MPSWRKVVCSGSIEQVDFAKLAYVSIDLNLVQAEMEVIHEIWPKIIDGSRIVLDDYGIRGHEEQHSARVEFS